MAADIRISGADDFLKLSKALKAAGQGGLRKELHKGVRDAVKPLIPLVRSAAASKLPHRGGLASRVAKAPIRVVPRTGSNPGVAIQMSKKQSAYVTGAIRHPVFADAATKTRREWSWVTQQVDGTWFDDTIWDNRGQVLDAVADAVDRVADQVVREVGHG